ncbi:MAG: 23S rRNA (adenine(2030)-N(6))-methyltransferase RlmJ [Alphaproteobacteria bacterium]|nr:23S rRNA (adenine(2030)-N(6))-methyltransferase RlmJ [Alphaproteobacteria bacterium]
MHKHALLSLFMDTLVKKSSRLCVIDTHAGRGAYDLDSPSAQKTSESRNGIKSLQDKTLPGLSAWLKIIEEEKLYPGSARIARTFLRPQDRLLMAELHPGEFGHLQSCFSDDPIAHARMISGYDLLLESVPPEERRGMVIMDPPYELDQDYKDAPHHLHLAYKKWPQGVYLLWYPILRTDGERMRSELLTSLRQTGMHDILVSEIRLQGVPAEGFAMHGSGLAIINPTLPESIVRTASETLANALVGSTKTFWLDNVEIAKETGLVAI